MRFAEVGIRHEEQSGLSHTSDSKQIATGIGVFFPLLWRVRVDVVTKSSGFACRGEQELFGGRAGIGVVADRVLSIYLGIQLFRSLQALPHQRIYLV